MAQLTINVGAAPNDGDGDPIRSAFIKCNDNFSQLFERVQTSAPPDSQGSAGDVAGMIAWDANFFYVCTGNYDGTTSIWERVAFDTTPW